MTFSTLNDQMNYYCRISKKTGNNSWNQDDVQKSFVEMISNCSLSLEQLETLETYIVKNDASIDMEPSNNKSYAELENMISIKKEETKISKQKIV